MIGTHMTSESVARSLGGLDPLSQVPSIGLCSSFWRNNQQQQQAQQQQQQNGFILGEVQNTAGIQELYQRLRLSANNYYPDNLHHSPVVLSNVGSSSSTSSSTILESAPVAGSELGYWNPTLSWSDLPTTNGAYP
uniref:Putative dof zinc finger protein DOF1.1-like n=2 Tax=Davidia involucrata TaxID=16924 RepID=A0A5B7AKP5_DAVIN